MTAKEFFNLVVKMRQMQKNWFKTHNYMYLEQSKQLEKQVDKEICRGIIKPPFKTPGQCPLMIERRPP